MQQRPIGNRTVSAIGLGEMPLSIEGRPDRRQAIATIHASLDAGVTIIDTADAYSLGVQEHGHGEELVAEALAAYGGPTDDVLVATKGGHRRPGDGSWTVHGDPAYVKEACEASLKALGVDAIGLYQYHRPDPVGPMGRVGGRPGRPARRGQDPDGRRLQRHGGADRRGAEGAGRPPGQRAERVLPALPLLGGRARALREARHRVHPVEPAWAASAAPTGSSRHFPAFAEVAAEVGASPQQVTLAWMLAKGSRVIPIPGSSRPETAIASAAAADITLTPEQVAPPRRLLSLIAGLRTVRNRTRASPCCTSVRIGADVSRGPSPGGRADVAESEVAMPAVTVPDTLVLPRIVTHRSRPLPSAPSSASRDAPSGFEGEGFPVRRAFAGVPVADLDPFIHMDQMGEVEYAPGEPKGTAWHPHRGFETVTYMIDGTFQHQDSIGGGGLITNGSTQWMTAGSGILHIERPPDQLDRQRRALPRHSALGEPPGGRQVARSPLPGHRGGRRPAADLARRRSAGPGDRR